MAAETRGNDVEVDDRIVEAIEFALTAAACREQARREPARATLWEDIAEAESYRASVLLRSFAADPEPAWLRAARQTG